MGSGLDVGVVAAVTSCTSSMPAWRALGGGGGGGGGAWWWWGLADCWGGGHPAPT